MKRDLCVLGGVVLDIAIPETRLQMESGWSLKPDDAIGILFDVKMFAPYFPLWVPVKIEGDHPLDVLWIEEGEVRALATLQRGCLQGYGDSVMELPAGFCNDKGIKVGARLIIGAQEALGN